MFESFHHKGYPELCFGEFSYVLTVVKYNIILYTVRASSLLFIQHLIHVFECC